MKEIIAIQNEIIKETAKLQLKKYRDEEGKFLIEGDKAVIEALSCGIKIEKIFVLNQKFLSQFLNFDQDNLFVVNEKVMKKLSSTQSPPTVLAVAKKIKNNLSSLLKLEKEKPFLIVGLENIKDGGNLGTIIRTSAAFDVSAIVLYGDCIDLYNPKVVRSAVGNFSKLPIIEINNLDELSQIKNLKMFATLMPTHKGVKPFDKADYKQNSLIWFGAEADGLSEELIEKSEEKITINMKNNVESLNLSISAGVILYETFRQRLS